VADATFFQFLASALRALEGEVPMANAALCAALSQLDVRIVADGQASRLCVRRGRSVLMEDGTAGAEIRLTRAVTESLLEGRLTLLGAVVDDHLSIRGAPAHVESLLEALDAFLRGAVRSVSMPALLEAYLGSAQQTSVKFTGKGMHDGTIEAGQARTQARPER
jgi:alkyl sulfatase BDS1-like metallo-beta-lactamase superfamily hydrolase